MLALMSCIYDSRPELPHRAATPGRAVLKPKPDYSLKDAYNALLDLDFLDLMFHVQAWLPESEPVLYTRDIGITALWSALQPCEQVSYRLPNGGVGTSIMFNMTQGLLPDLSLDDIEAFKVRLGL